MNEIQNPNITKSQINPKSQIQRGHKMKEKKYDLKERTFKFAQRILEIAERLYLKPKSEVARYQLTKSGTSIGANVEEGDGAITKKDFINKMAIARKEAKETRYWLKLISGRYLDKGEIDNDITECWEIIRILSSIINKSL